jgi:hypothetical protein
VGGGGERKRESGGRVRVWVGDHVMTRSSEVKERKRDHREVIVTQSVHKYTGVFVNENSSSYIPAKACVIQMHSVYVHDCIPFNNENIDLHSTKL